MKKIGLYLALFAFLASCSVEPEPIKYGDDQCNYCKMGIVDQQHSAQYVTAKGKQYKFDAIECMVRKLQDPTLLESNMKFVLVADYQNPGAMTDAKSASFLICKKIKSPMGAYLSGFSESDKASEVQSELGGKLYSWDELKDHFNK